PAGRRARRARRPVARWRLRCGRGEFRARDSDLRLHSPRWANTPRETAMSVSMEEKFQTLHEIVKAARQNLAPGPWDYLIRGAESEPTLNRNRQAIDSIALRPRVLRNVSKVDPGATFLGQRLRIPVMLAPVGSIESFDPAGGAAAAKASAEF